MTINSTQQQIMKILFHQSKSNTDDIFTEKIKNKTSFALRNTAERLANVLPKISLKSTEFENMEFLNVDEEVEYVWKDWKFFITDASNIDVDILMGLILHFIDYDIIYSEAQGNDTDFYNSELDLQEVFYYSVDNDVIYLNISTYMSRYFDSPPLVVPQAKVRINFKNPFAVFN